jgi:exosome complex component RRP4
MTDRKIVIPGEVIAEGNDYLPGEGTEKKGEGIIAIRYGLAEESNKLVKVIPLSGVYQPRRGNVVIGVVENVTFNGWVVNIDTAQNAFLPLSEYPRYVNKDEVGEVMGIGEMIVAKIFSINQRGIDLTMRLKGLGKIDRGMILKINPNKVPRVIGKEGSMISMIKDETNCRITVGQNGLIWIDGDKIEDEIFSKKAINFITEKSFVSGLTEEIKKWFEGEKGK